MKKPVIALLLFLLSALTSPSFAQKAKGSLFIIGGGERSDSLIGHMVRTASLRSGDYIVILPMASEQPEAGYALISRQLARHTNAPVLNFNLSSAGAPRDRWTDSLKNARLIYILGGDQNRFMRSVLHSPAFEAIHDAFRNGATIAGTSAGAAVMSRYMITGRQLLDTVYNETFDKLRADNIEFAEGLGLLQNTIIDQHFLKRSRYGRLLSALAAKPDHICVGIDESTAIIVRGDHATVVGESQVLRFSGGTNRNRTSGSLLQMKKVELDIFTAGETMMIKP